MLSIITAIHNQLPMNKVYLEYLNKYTDGKFELIIIDNASTDGSAEFFEANGAIVIRNDGNYSYPYAQNQGIKIAKYDNLAFLNNDIIVSPHWNSRLIKTMNDNQLEAITACGVERLESKFATKINRTKWNIIKKVVSKFGSAESQILLMHKLMYNRWEHFCDSRYAKFSTQIKEGFVGNTVLFKRSLIDKVGLWDERIQGADFDLYLRIKQRQLDVGDIKPLSYALGVYVHHFIRFTLADGKYPPFVDLANIITVEEKWGDLSKTYLKDQEW